MGGEGREGIVGGVEGKVQFILSPSKSNQAHQDIGGSGPINAKCGVTC